MTKEIIQSKINEVSNSFPSLFSKEDVIKVLTSLGEELESKPSTGFNFEEFKRGFLRNFEDSLNRECSSELVDFDSADFSIGYNKQIEIEGIEVYTDKIKELAEEAFDETANEDYLIDESAS